MSPSPLGETLRRSRTAKGITLEDAERVTRIPRKYLEALELENFGILPAPVYARGFLRSYASYLGIEPNDLLPFFPVGHVDEPKLDPLPEMGEPRTWNMNGVVAMAVVGMLVLLVIGLYTVGKDDNSPFDRPIAQDPGVITGDDTADQGGGDVAAGLPDLVGQTQQQAISHIQSTGAQYIIINVAEGDFPVGQVVAQSPEVGTIVGPDSLVKISVAK